MVSWLIVRRFWYAKICEEFPPKHTSDELREIPNCEIINLNYSIADTLPGPFLPFPSLTCQNSVSRR